MKISNPGLSGGVVALCLLAQTGSAQSARTPLFVSPEQLNMAAILPAPPAGDSWQSASEIADLRRIQETRTPAAIAHAQSDEAEESIFAFADVLGERFTRAELPITALLSEHVRHDEGVIVNPAKNFFHRPRPYRLDASIKPVCKTTDNPTDYSYPSGHGTTGYLEALVLLQMVPEMRNAILARADDYAYSREVCGVHYASDEAASKAVAYSMMAIMMNHPQFKKELEAARAETRKALGLTDLPDSAGH